MNFRIRPRPPRRLPTSTFLLSFLVANLSAVLAHRPPEQPRPTADGIPRRLLLQQIRVKPEMIDAFVYLQRNETVPALKKAGVAWRDVYQTTAVGRTGLFAFITEISGLKELDETSPVERALGDGYSAYRGKLRAMIEESASSIIRTRPDLSMLGDPSVEPRLGVVARMEIHPGKSREFESWVKQQYLDIVRRSNCRAYWVSQTLLGGPANEYWSLTLGDSFAAFDQSPMMQVLGSDGAEKLTARTGAFISRVEQFIVRYRADMSFRTQQ